VYLRTFCFDDLKLDASSPPSIDALFLAIGTLGSLTSFGKIEQAPTWDPQRDLLPAPKCRYQRPSIDS